MVTAKQVRCIYVAMGQKGSTIAGVRQALEDNGAMDFTTIVAAPAWDPASYKYIAPYTGSYWMYAGKHVLIVFDNLSKQADAYRAVSLLLRRPPAARSTPATSSTCTPGCSSAARSSPTTWAVAR